MQALVRWLDDRTGIQKLLHEALYERVPGGARWRYVWGSTLVYAFVTQVVTGIFLWMSYSPSTQTAWESVYYIQHQMWGGWLLRGIHHFMAQAMIVLMALHVVQVVIDGAYKAPREINFWLGLVLMQIVLGLSLTGYLLPWDQKGYAATTVATNLIGLVPFIGPQLQTIVVGGPAYGHHTLTRFFALHAGVLPGLLIGFLVLHIALFRRHGLTAKLPLKKPDGLFWPDQILKDAVACLAVMAVVLLFVVRAAVFEGEHDLGRLGAELHAPADPTAEANSPRPEWYFLFLFQLLKYFPGESERIGALYLPGFVMGLLVLMPIIGKWKLGHRFNVALTFGLLAGAAMLTYIAWHADNGGPNKERYLAGVANAREEADRAIELAKSPAGIPVGGAVTLLHDDPKVQGKREFTAKCAVCHGKPAGKDANGNPTYDGGATLAGFADRAWIAGLLDAKRVVTAEYFGNTAHHKGDMIDFVTGELTTWPKDDVEAVTVALSAEAGLFEQKEQDAADIAKIEAGRKLLADDSKCAGCHKFYDAGGEGGAPDLTGYGSRQWLIDFVGNPSHERFYGKNNDRMPAFAAEPPGSDKNLLAAKTLGLIVDYLRKDWYRPTK